MTNDMREARAREVGEALLIFYRTMSRMRRRHLYLALFLMILGAIRVVTFSAPPRASCGMAMLI